MRKLLQKASSLKQLTKDEIEQIYDVSGTLEDVLSGKNNISYSDFNKIQSAVFNTIPSNVLGDTDFTEYAKEVESVLGSKFKGDSNLLNSSLTDILNSLGMKDETGKRSPENEEKDGEPRGPEPREPDPPKPDEPIKEKPLDTQENPQASGQEENSTSSLRPRMQWGNTDELFFRKDNEVKEANLIADAMMVQTPGWGNGADNSLFKMNLKQDDMRYGRTFSMPPSPPSQSDVLPQRFVNVVQPIWVSQYPPAQRPFLEQTRDPYLFGQYNNFTPEMTQTVYPRVEQNVQTGEWPHVADMMTHGVEQQVSRRWDPIVNQRFTRN